jgi:hypothetical protein
MKPPKVADHVANATGPVMNEYYIPELEEYLTRFANMCEQGEFEALQVILKMALTATGSHFGYT